jgi:hypothetical protein
MGSAPPRLREEHRPALGPRPPPPPPPPGARRAVAGRVPGLYRRRRARGLPAPGQPRRRVRRGLPRQRPHQLHRPRAGAAAVGAGRVRRASGSGRLTGGWAEAARLRVALGPGQVGRRLQSARRTRTPTPPPRRTPDRQAVGAVPRRRRRRRARVGAERQHPHLPLHLEAAVRQAHRRQRECDGGGAWFGTMQRLGVRSRRRRGRPAPGAAARRWRADALPFRRPPSACSGAGRGRARVGNALHAAYLPVGPGPQQQRQRRRRRRSGGGGGPAHKQRRAAEARRRGRARRGRGGGWSGGPAAVPARGAGPAGRRDGVLRRPRPRARVRRAAPGARAAAPPRRGPLPRARGGGGRGGHQVRVPERRCVCRGVTAVINVRLATATSRPGQTRRSEGRRPRRPRRVQHAARPASAPFPSPMCRPGAPLRPL